MRVDDEDAPMASGWLVGRFGPPFTRGGWLVLAALNVANALEIASEPWSTPSGGWLNFDIESSPAPWFTATLFVVAAGLAALCTDLDQRDRKWFVVLGAVCLALSVEEITGVHERVNAALGPGEGVAFFAWVVPGSVVGAVLVVGAVSFARRLPLQARLRMVGAVAAYFAGAIVMELVAGVWVDDRGTDNLGFYVMATVEENLEMLGAFGLVLALLTFIRTVTARDRSVNLLVHSSSHRIR